MWAERLRAASGHSAARCRKAARGEPCSRIHTLFERRSAGLERILFAPRGGARLVKPARGIGNVLRTLTRHPGYVLMRSVARIEPLRNTVVALQKATRGSLDSYLRSLETQRSPFFGELDAKTIADGVARD